jgi:aryl carrier-like protein
MLPDYMVPSVVVTLDQLPLTVSGKIDRKALPKPEYAQRLRAAPSTPTEEVLAALWAEALQLDEVGVQDNFFDLGGHSLLGMQLVRKIRTAFGVDVPLRALFEDATIEALGRHLDSRAEAAGTTVVPAEAAPERRSSRLARFLQLRKKA